MLPVKSLLTGPKAAEPMTSRESIALVSILACREMTVLTKQGHKGLGGLEELGSGDGVVLGGIDRDIREGLLEGVEPGTVSGNGSHYERCQLKQLE